MNTERTGMIHWLDWSQAALPAVVDWLCQRFGSDGSLDLSRVLVLTPGSSSQSRLLELLVERSEREKYNLEPPGFASLSQLPERLYTPKRPFADSPAQLVAWVRALQSSSEDELHQLLKAVPPSNQFTAWLPLARLVRSLHVDLASESLSFGDVLGALSPSEPPHERARWRLLERLQRGYYDQLSQVGLWDQQAARLEAIRRAEVHFDGEIVLVGMVDMNRVFRKMLLHVASHVHALVFAGPESSDGFDEVGCLRSEYWLDQPIDLNSDQIHVADRPADQASEVIDALSGLDGALPAAQITIGILDRSAASHIRRALDLAGVANRDAAGKSLDQTLPLRLLKAVADYLHQPKFAQYARLVRHPDCFDWISEQIGELNWLRSLDEFQNEFIPGELTLRRGFRPAAGPALHRVHAAVRTLLAPLSGRPRRLSEWSGPWLDLLAQVYGRRDHDGESLANRETFTSCLKIQAALQTLADVPSDWPIRGSAADALDLAMDQLAGLTIGEPEKPDAIQLTGWLDLPLDDAAATIVVGMNEEFVPSSENPQLFLPNALRTRLDLLDNSRRYARDAYALSLMARSPRQLTLICGRRSGDGDPLLPSRLLLAAAPQTMAERARAFFCHKSDATSPIWLAAGPDRPTRQQFSIPRPNTEDLRIASLRVTDFKYYLQCPYRFYLERVLRLRPLADNLNELPAFAFGDLVHRVVESFGRNAIRDSTEPADIREFLRRELARELDRLGDEPSAAIQIQHQQIRLRLDRLAELQAERRRAGWQIIEVEVPQATATLVVDGQPFVLRGRIDRVERHLDSGELAVFDYKTRNPPLTPEAAHRQRGKWIDLQLPLYRHLIRRREYFDEAPIRLGYVSLPGDLKQTEFALATWTEEDLREADEAAWDVIRAVRRNEFWPPQETPPDFSETWAAICQDHVAERWEPAEVAP